MSVFLSTPSARRATQGLEQYNRHNQNFYPRPLRGGRRENGDVAHHTVVISIHALCEEGDLQVSKTGKIQRISIHALCEEGDVSNLVQGLVQIVFLSTPSARRATTRTGPGSCNSTIFLSTPSARRATTCLQLRL